MAVDSTSKLIQSIIDALRSNPKVRFWLTLISSILLLISGAFAISFLYIFNSDDYGKYRTPSLIATAFLFYICLISWLSYSSFKFDDVYNEQLQELQKEKKDLKKKISSKARADILDTIQLNLNQLNEYYTINKSQARNSFRISVGAIVLGLFILLVGVWFFYIGEKPNVTMTALSSLSGILIQFIGGAYFYLYKRSLEQLNFFFSQLVKMQDTMLSIKLCEQITKEDKQIEVREKIIFSLLERSLLVAEIFQKKELI